jgi:hypothetical protein
MDINDGKFLYALWQQLTEEQQFAWFLSLADELNRPLNQVPVPLIRDLEETRDEEEATDGPITVS